MRILFILLLLASCATRQPMPDRELLKITCSSDEWEITTCEFKSHYPTCNVTLTESSHCPSGNFDLTDKSLEVKNGCTATFYILCY